LASGAEASGAKPSTPRRVPHITVNSFDSNDPYHPSSITNGNGRTTAMTWDQYGNLLTITPPSNGVRTQAATIITYSYTFFPMGEMTQKDTGTKTSIQYAYDHTDGYTDALGNFYPCGLITAVSAPTPGTIGGSTRVTTSYIYDVTGRGSQALGALGLGNVLAFTTPGNPSTVVGGVDQGITTTYNYTADGTYTQAAAIGQQLTATDNLGKVTHFRYDSRDNLLSSTDALGNEYDATYNIADQRLTSTGPATGQSGTGRAYRQATYLYSGGPATQILAYDEGNTVGAIRQISYTYGSEGEILGTSGSTEPGTCTYDSMYRLKSLTDGGGHTTYYRKSRKAPAFRHGDIRLRVFPKTRYWCLLF
jgi:YD repeat-containing protein